MNPPRPAAARAGQKGGVGRCCNTVRPLVTTEERCFDNDCCELYPSSNRVQNDARTERRCYLDLHDPEVASWLKLYIFRPP